MIEELRDRANNGDPHAASLLVESLKQQGKFDQLLEEIHAGTSGAPEALIGLFEQQGDRVLTERLRRFGLDADGNIRTEPPPGGVPGGGTGGEMAG
ncbi:MAG TPA: hypothetical protein VFZ32_12030 [Micromonosporaceae bacterium]